MPKEKSHPIDNILSIEDMRLKRSVGAFINWVDVKIEEIPEDKETSKKLRTTPSRIWGYFTDESMPLKHYLKSTYGDTEDVFVEMYFDSRNYDAKIFSDKEIHIEITKACDGEQDHHRKLILNQEGSVTAFGKIIIKGTKKSGFTHTPPPLVATTPSKICEERLELIKKALLLKIKKDYPAHTILLISFDDYTLSHEEHLISGIKNIVEKNDMGEFIKIVVLGETGKIYTQ
ncbi:MAG: hypothetical protein JKY11_08825 [Alphaproteobacteria bacterium]|nr:hypothetical protein [Alphaproteobacteria bacterium]